MLGLTSNLTSLIAFQGDLVCYLEVPVHTEVLRDQAVVHSVTQEAEGVEEMEGMVCLPGVEDDGDGQVHLLVLIESLTEEHLGTWPQS